MGTATFPRAVRLRSPAEFSQVFRSGSRSADACFMVFARGNGSDAPRLGLAVARKASPKAADRNRIKRVVRECFRLNRALLPAVDIVVQARAAAAHRNLQELRASLDWHWQEVIKRCKAS